MIMKTVLSFYDTLQPADRTGAEDWDKVGSLYYLLIPILSVFGNSADVKMSGAHVTHVVEAFSALLHLDRPRLNWKHNSEGDLDNLDSTMSASVTDETSHELRAVVREVCEKLGK